jgi:hypothetical protein
MTADEGRASVFDDNFLPVHPWSWSGVTLCAFRHLKSEALCEDYHEVFQFFPWCDLDVLHNVSPFRGIKPNLEC